MMLVYIGAWNPHMIRIPVAVRLFRRNLERLGSTPHVARVSDSESAFETVWSEMQSAMKTIDPSKDTDDAKLLKSGSGESVSDGVVKERHRRKGTLHWGGIPIWAVFVSAGCLSLVAVMVYIGNCVTKRFNIRQQQKKYTAGTMRLANERWRSTDGGGGSPPNVGSGGNANANGSSAPQNTKSSMMFRQFNTGTKKQRQPTNQVQKI
ncbi:hypothetical protein AAVH_34132 [Aphelenchoides avenae]|nr:hypothetical protein AAVH_34132 [Aphelenchus avenae]